MTHHEAMRFLTQRSGKQFDPRVVEVLARLSPEELDEQQDPIAHGEYSRIRTDTFEPVYVDAALA
ncbi:MAG: hypothetical protein M3R52_08995 [Acidobacteriota bacterium]|nr:hypothetical protein [Acidobacteriota bacterium]